MKNCSHGKNLNPRRFESHLSTSTKPPALYVDYETKVLRSTVRLRG